MENCQKYCWTFSVCKRQTVQEKLQLVHQARSLKKMGPSTSIWKRFVPPKLFWSSQVPFGRSYHGWTWASLHHYYYSTSGSSLPSTSTSSPPPLVATIYSGLLGERGAWGLKSKFYRGCSDLTESVTPPQRLPSLPPL